MNAGVGFSRIKAPVRQWRKRFAAKLLGLIWNCRLSTSGRSRSRAREPP